MSEHSQLDLLFQAPPVTRRIWTVGDLLSRIRTELEREYTDIWVEGEISNLRQAESGHLYFTLKDDGAQIRIVMFRSQARLLRFRPEDGQQVIARGRVTAYESRGELQLSAEYLEPHGAGALQIAFEQLKQKLAAEGLFDQAHKKPVPALPRRIGVVTSPRGAAIQDIVNILRRRHESVHILIYPAQVQGETAPREVAAGVRWFNRARNVEVIIVARGGGSIEDLAAFNDEALARVVAGSGLPVVSAIGHETDFTIIDFVADLRAPTPSAAAELVIRSKHEVEEQLGALRRRLARGARYHALMGRQRLTELAQHGAFARITDMLGRRQQALDDLNYRLATAAAEILQRYRRRMEIATARVRSFDVPRRLSAMRRDLHSWLERLGGTARNKLLRRRARVDQLSAQLQALSPLNILERGYALVFDSAGNLVKDAAQVQVGDDISARLARGHISGKVTAKS